MKSISLLIVAVLLGLSKASADTEGGWDCHRSEDDKEWLCSTRTPKPLPKLETPGTAVIEQAPPTTTVARPPEQSTSPVATPVTPALEAAPTPAATVAAGAETVEHEMAAESEQAEPQLPPPRNKQTTQDALRRRSWVGRYCDADRQRTLPKQTDPRGCITKNSRGTTRRLGLRTRRRRCRLGLQTFRPGSARSSPTSTGRGIRTTAVTSFFIHAGTSVRKHGGQIRD